MWSMRFGRCERVHGGRVPAGEMRSRVHGRRTPNAGRRPSCCDGSVGLPEKLRRQADGDLGFGHTASAVRMIDPITRLDDVAGVALQFHSGVADPEAVGQHRADGVASSLRLVQRRLLVDHHVN